VLALGQLILTFLNAQILAKKVRKAAEKFNMKPEDVAAVAVQKCLAKKPKLSSGY